MNSPGPYMLAPMAELSHRALRELIEGFNGPPAPVRPEYYTEMISVPALLAGGPFEEWYLDGGPCPERLVYQLLGADEGPLAAAAALLDRRDCLGIDVNMGCAAPVITKTGAGVRLMEDMDKAGRIIAALRRVTKKRLSAKLRLGPRGFRLPRPGPAGEAAEKSPSAGFEYLLEFCRRLESQGLDLIILHPRLAGEKFKGRARWDYVEALRGELSIPVAGNGDIAGWESMESRAREGPVMIGRLAVKEPWIFTRRNSPSLPDRDLLEKTALHFLDLLARYQPPEFHLSRARRFFRYYCDNFIWAEYLRNKINREETLEGMGRIIRGHCRTIPENAAP